MTPATMDLEHATESTIAKASARILMPIMVAVLMIVLGICGYLIVQVLSGVNATVSALQQGQKATGDQVNEIDKKVSLMSQRVDQMLIRQVEQNSDTLKAHEQRLQRIERVVPQP